MRARPSGEVADFRFAVLGAKTLVIRGDRARFVPGSYRVLLARVELDLSSVGVFPEQAAFYLPELDGLQNPFDIGSAAVSYANRHPELKSVFVVAPKRGLVTIVMDAIVRSLPGFDTRLLRDPAEATRLLRLRDHELPLDWHEHVAPRVLVPDPFAPPRA